MSDGASRTHPTAFGQPRINRPATLSRRPRKSTGSGRTRWHDQTQDDYFGVFAAAWLLCRLAQEDEDALLVADNRIGRAVVVQVCGGHLGADARVAVDLVRGVRSALLALLELAPEQDGRSIGFDIARRAVGPESLAGQDVLLAVAVDVDEIQAVHLADSQLLGIHVGLDGQNHVLLPGDLSLGVLDLLVPDQAVLVAVPSGDDVVQTVAVNVVDQHLGRIVSKLERVQGPRLVRLRVGRGFPPAILFEDANTAVAFDVAEADAVREAVVLPLGRDGVEDPRVVRLGRIPGRIAQVFVDVIDQVRTAVAVDIAPHRRLVADVLQGRMLLPMSVLAGRVLVPEALFARERHAEDVRIAVAVEVVDIGEEVLGIAAWLRDLDGHVLVFLGEVRALEPPWAGHNVHLPVLVEVAVIRAFGVELVGQLKLLELRERFGNTHCTAHAYDGQSQNRASHGGSSRVNKIRCDTR